MGKEPDSRSEIVILRSSALVIEPRVKRAYDWLEEAGYRPRIVVWDREGNFESQSNGPRVHAIRLKATYGGGFRLIFAILRWNVRILKHLLAAKPEFIHACDLDTVIPAIICKRLVGSKVIYDIFDWYSETHPVGPLQGVVTAIERWAVSQVDAVILAHEARTIQLGSAKQPLVVAIHNSPTPSKRLTDPPFQMRRPYVAYCGLLAADRGIEAMIAAAVSAEVELVIAGWGPLESMCTESSLHHPNVRFLGRLSHDDVLAIEADAAALVACYDPRVPNNRLAAPNKVYEAMMLARPLITNTGTLAAQMVEEEHCGIMVDFGDVAALSQAIVSVVKEGDSAARFGENGLKAYERSYSAEEMRTRLLALYSQVQANGESKTRPIIGTTRSPRRGR